MLKKIIFPSSTKNHGWGPSNKETIFTWASAVTAIRLVLTLYFVVLAMESLRIEYIVYALASYWVGDVIDGIVARATGRETQVGAVFDIAADRLSVVMIYMLFALYNPSLTLPIIIFLIAFVIVDTILSVSFLKYNLLSINYFYLVDQKLYDLNWSILAKATTTSIFMIVALAVQDLWLSLFVAIMILLVKCYSLYLFERLETT